MRIDGRPTRVQNSAFLPAKCNVKGIVRELIEGFKLGKTSFDAFREQNMFEKLLFLSRLCSWFNVVVVDFQKKNKLSSEISNVSDNQQTRKVLAMLFVLRCRLTRAKLLANAANFTRGLHVERPHTQFTCVTCSLYVKTGKFTRVYAASNSRRLHANCLQSQVHLPERNGYFTGNFACGTYANFLATTMQNYLRLQAKIHAICRQKH